MTPKEKAKELVAKFNKTIPIDTNNVPNLSAIKKSYERHNKECALISVDEMIEQNGELYLNSLGDKTIAFYKAKNAYLFEVKQEINNL